MAARKTLKYAWAPIGVSNAPVAKCLECGRDVPRRKPGQSGAPRIYCTVFCTKKSARRKNKQLSGRRNNIDARAILERDAWFCHMCGVTTPEELRGMNEPRSPEVDHVVPWSRGGSDAPSNLACACRKCNSEKGSHMSLEEAFHGPATPLPAR